MLGGLQHVAAMVVGMVTPPLLVGSALGLNPEEIGQLVSATLLASGLATLLQVARLGPVGSGMLSVQGTSFVFVMLAIQAGERGGLPLIFGMTLLTAPTELLVAASVHRARRLFPPIVTGGVVALIGLSLIKVAMGDLAGGLGSPDLGSAANMALGSGVAALIVLWSQLAPGVWRTAAVAVGLVAGYGVALATGRVDLSSVGDQAWLRLPHLPSGGLAFDPVLLLPWVVGFAITSVESVGDLTATSEVSGEPVQGPVFARRVRGGLMADALGSMGGALIGALPNTTFSQNNGVIALTGVAARRVGVAVAGILVLLGLSPRSAALLTAMPRPVLGGATLLLFGSVAVAGLRIAWSTGMAKREQTILATTLASGLGVSLVPEAIGPWGADMDGALGVAVQSLRMVAASGLAVGAIVATLLNLLLPSDAADPEREAS